MGKKIMMIGTNVMNLYSQRLELINRLKSKGYEIVIVCPDRGNAYRLREIGCKVDSFDFDSRSTNPIKDFQLLFAIDKFIAAENPDLIYTFYTKTNIYGGLAARHRGIPYIENITGLGSGIARGGFISKMTMKLYMAGIKKAPVVFFQNSRDHDFFVRHGIEKSICRYLPGSGVCLKRFIPRPYPDDSGGVTFSFISRILKEKGICEYLEAARIIKKRHPSSRFLVVGPYSEPKLLSVVRDYERDGVITYYPQTNDVHPFIEESHCTIFPSYYAEGMANILLESAASGRPIITTSLPGCGETVDDGVTGFITRPRDVDDLVHQIERFLSMNNEDRRLMGLAGRRKMEREFNREIVVDAYIKATNEILSTK